MTAQQKIDQSAIANGWQRNPDYPVHSFVARYVRPGEQIHIWFNKRGAVIAYSAYNDTGVLVHGGARGTRDKLTRVTELLEG